MKALVTGGAGFIGSHLVDSLLENEDNEVIVFDNLTTGSLENLRQRRKENGLRLVFSRRELTNTNIILPKEIDVIFHFAANAAVRPGSQSSRVHVNQNILATYNILEASRKSTRLKSFVFASSSTVYGEAEKIPTPEDYGPLKPISTYGASKLAAESLVSAYASTYGFRAVIYRLANVIGRRSDHGIIPDLIRKLRDDPKVLEILGDGTQNKSYLHVSDCVRAVIFGLAKSKSQVEIYNVGSEDQINALKVAEIVSRGIGLPDVRFELKSTEPDGRGWSGDVRMMLLDISKIKSLGWRPLMNSEEAVRRTVLELVTENRSA